MSDHTFGWRPEDDDAATGMDGVSGGSRPRLGHDRRRSGPAFFRVAPFAVAAGVFGLGAIAALTLPGATAAGSSTTNGTAGPAASTTGSTTNASTTTASTTATPTPVAITSGAQTTTGGS